MMTMKLRLWRPSQTAAILQSNATADLRSPGTAHLVVLVGAVSTRRRSRHSSRYAEATTRRTLRRRIDNPSGNSNESLSKIIKRRQIAEDRRAKTSSQRSTMAERHASKRGSGLRSRRGIEC
jgi:hypothetical protein